MPLATPQAWATPSVLGRISPSARMRMVRREQRGIVRTEHIGGDGARYGGPGGVRHRIEGEDGGDGLIDAGTELVQQLACGGPLLAQVFDIGPGDGIEGRFGHGADRGNQHHKKDGEQQSDHDRDLAGPSAPAVERDMEYGSVALTVAEGNAPIRRKGRAAAGYGARCPFSIFSGKRKNGEVAEKDKKTLDVLGFFV
jgi:hypothetical protein